MGCKTTDYGTSGRRVDRLNSVHPLEQHLESSLLKVVIGSNSFLHRARPHGRKGDTVGERPFFVRPRRKQGHALLEKSVRWQQDLDVLQLFEAVQKRSERSEEHTSE